MPTKKTKKSNARSKRKPKAKARSANDEVVVEETTRVEREPVVETTEPEEIVVEEKTRVERAPVVVRREPVTLARALADDVVIETEPEVEKTVVRKRRRVA